MAAEVKGDPCSDQIAGYRRAAGDIIATAAANAKFAAVVAAVIAGTIVALLSLRPHQKL